MEFKQIKYIVAMVIGVLLIVINGILVWNLLHNEVQFDSTCPVPKDEIEFCKCSYSPNYLKGKRIDVIDYCTCYPKGTEDIQNNNSIIQTINFSKINLNGTR